MIRVHQTPVHALGVSLIRFNNSPTVADEKSGDKQRHSDSVIHEPCRLLGDLQAAGNLPRANAILGVHDQPHCGKPFVETQRGILEDRPCLQRELRGRVLLAAVPAIVLLQEQHVLAATARANDAIRPATGHKILAAVLRIGEVENGLL